MATRYFGAPIRRNEDSRLLTGQALFVDDVELPGMLHAAFLRSQVAHARIGSVDLSAALAREGVVAAYVAGDLGSYWQPGPVLVPPPPIRGIVFNARTHGPLAKDKVRYVGEPLAVVIAESRYIAEDALADIVVELESLPAVVDLEKALASDSALVHDDVRGNLSAHVRQAKGDYAAAAARADHVTRRRFVYDRGASSPMETRGVVAQWDARGDQLTVETLPFELTLGLEPPAEPPAPSGPPASPLPPWLVKILEKMPLGLQIGVAAGAVAKK